MVIMSADHDAFSVSIPAREDADYVSHLLMDVLHVRAQIHPRGCVQSEGVIGKVIVDGSAKLVESFARRFQPFVRDSRLHLEGGNFHLLGTCERSETNQFIRLAGMI